MTATNNSFMKTIDMIRLKTGPLFSFRDAPHFADYNHQTPDFFFPSMSELSLDKQIVGFVCKSP
jgi:hypothetical protein